MFEAGSKLSEMLGEWNADTDEITLEKGEVEKTKEWDDVNDIENELDELEKLFDSLPTKLK